MRLTNISDSSTSKKVLISTVCSLILMAAFLIVLKSDRQLYILLAKEGRNTELLTAIFYLLSGILFIMRGYKSLGISKSKQAIIFYLLFGLFFIFIAGEEESWGQWLFSFETPEQLSEINVQNELNVHNLKYFAMGDLLDPHRILNLFVVAVGILLPIINYFWYSLSNFLVKINFPVCPISVTPIFIMALVYEKVAHSIWKHWAHAEIMEFFFSIGFLLFAISLGRAKKNSDVSQRIISE